MSDNEIEDVSFLPGAASNNKKVIYDPNNLQRCQQLVLSRNRAILVVSLIIGAIVIIALIAAFARSGTPSCDQQQSSLSHSDASVVKPTTATATNGEPFPWTDIRLPDSVIPISYDLFMWPNLTTFHFDGNVTILVEARKTVDFIVFHSKELKFRSKAVARVRSSTGNSDIAVLRSLEYVRHEQVYIQLQSSLEKGERYLLKLEFSGTLTDSLTGFYRSSYETAAGQKRWLATTHFEPTDARAAFPCFDEPQLKANFTLSIVRQPNQVALFNTERIGDRQIAEGRLVVDQFATTVKMSTYLVAFVVCDFSRKHKFTKKSGIEVSVYAPSDMLNQTDFALNVATEVLDFYETFYGIKYPLNKSDHIAIPDFGAGAMENWGLVTYLMRSLLFNPTESSSSDQQWVAIVVAHELAHQWFGNLVTMKWWNDLWLNEGFARFVECVGTNEVQPDFKMMDIFVDDALSVALYSDSLASSHPISVPVFDPSEIGEIFDAISYEKGASVIRMLESFLGTSKFISGLRRYLQRHQYGNAETDDLWLAMTEELSAGGALSSDIPLTVKDIMDTWTLQMGYPVITVTRHGRDITASQQRFLYNPRANLTEEFTSPYGYKWYVPLTYVTSAEPQRSFPVVWMKKDDAQFKIESDNIKWIKFNANMTGVYRVHYSDDNWQALIQQLRQNHSVFSIPDRTSLLSDAFALARSGHLNITTALEMSLYLVNETEYVPWQAALSALGYIGDLLESHPDYMYFKRFMQHLTRNIINRLGWTDKGDHLTKLLRASVLGDSIHRGDDESIVQVRKLFADWSKGNKSISANLKSVVYVGGIKYGDYADWNYVWKRFERSQIPSEKSKLLASLAGSTDVSILNRFLQLSLNESFIRSAETPSVLQLVATNPSGRVLAWRFVRANWKLLYDRYHIVMMKMRRVILGVCSHFSTQFDYDEVKTFFKANLRGENFRSVSQALEKIGMNIDWLARNERNVLAWLKANPLK